MICYKDMTFCPATDCAKFSECDRALTYIVRLRANAIGIPLCINPHFECFEPKHESDENNRPD